MEKANIAYQYRIYPTSCQKKLIAKTFGCSRKVYNLMLSDKIRLYRETGKMIRIPKLGRVKIRLHHQAPKDYRLKSVTLSETADGTYTVSVLYEYEEAMQAASGTTHIGLDYRSDGLYVDSNGECCDMPLFFRKSQKRLARAQRKLSRKQGTRKGEAESANHRKQRLRAAKIARHTANQRKDFLHKKSAEITNLYDVISVESLNMKGMSRTLHLGKATMDNGYGMFVSMLEYKKKRKRHQLIRVGRYFPSSQLCQCGYKNPVTKDLKVRMITCPVCGKTYDRDENAAVNIDKEGYRMVMSA
ncbi:MAG: RNA-guided endonuclease TnpB family protein [Eubacteriales bacterium]|nr:RNA-guided endonuclease TnpB family protein [Eubacteriales bacterium]